MTKVLITGGTGLIGKALTKELVNKGYDVIILTRNKSGYKNSESVSFAEWDVEKRMVDSEAIAKADYIVHLAGANIAERRWTEKRKKQISDSRVQSGNLLSKAVAEIPNNIKAIVSASAIGWYGPDPQIPNPRPFVETDEASDDFLGSTCRKWEEAIRPVQAPGRRLVIFRPGIVLTNDGGAYPEFKKPLRFGLATILGNGRQMISWIHIADLVRLYIEALANDQLAGVYNAVAPNPVNNKTLICQMARQLKKMYIKVPVPVFILKAVLGELSIEVLKSATVSSRKIESTSFQFTFPHIETAIQNLKIKAS